MTLDPAQFSFTDSNTNCVHSATDDFNHGVVLSNRPLRSNEVFQVRIDKMVDKWAGSIEIGVTTHNPAYLQLPSTMTNLRSGEVVEELSPDLSGYLVKMITRGGKQRREGEQHP